MFETCVATIGKARSPTVDRFDVWMANVSDDHDRSPDDHDCKLLLDRMGPHVTTQVQS